MNFITSVLSVVGVFTVCTAHLCLISPRQRGSIMNLNKAGSTDCILLTGPCGGRIPAKPEVTWQSGGNFTAIFQKNLDHWVQATPGYFSVSIIANGQAQELTRIQDGGEPSLHLYTATGKLPSNIDATTYQLQVTYVTKNPQAPPMFYQCSDVLVQ